CSARSAPFLSSSLLARAFPFSGYARHRPPPSFPHDALPIWSLLAPSHADAATVEGYGSVPYEHICQEMLAALEAEEDPELALTMRKVFLDHDDGQLVAVESRSRQFPPALARLLRYAHQTC